MTALPSQQSQSFLVSNQHWQQQLRKEGANKQTNQNPSWVKDYQLMSSVSYRPFFSRSEAWSTEHSELLIESEARRAESSEAWSAKSRSDVAPNARRCAQGDANLGQGLYMYIYIFIYLFIYLDVWTDHNNGADVTSRLELVNWLVT